MKNKILMKLEESVQTGPNNEGARTIKGIIDLIETCNLNCLYCHPGRNKMNNFLPVAVIRNIIEASKTLHGVQEIVLTGGETLMHPEIKEILSIPKKQGEGPNAVLITNATLLKNNPEIVNALRQSTFVTRLCVSLDSKDPDAHNLRRRTYGDEDTHDKVIEGLKIIRDTVKKPVTVISVLDKANKDKILELSRFLAEEKLATQHHLAAVCFAGGAKETPMYYEDQRLRMDDFYQVQEALDNTKEELSSLGVEVTFNSFPIATGKLSKHQGRKLTFTVFSEMLEGRGRHFLVRPDGSVRAALAYWGREDLTGDQTRNRLDLKRPDLQETIKILHEIDTYHRSSDAKILTAKQEAFKKHWLDWDQPEREPTREEVEENWGKELAMESVPPLMSSKVLRTSFTETELEDLASCIATRPFDFRFIQEPSGVIIVYDEGDSSVMLLKKIEFTSLCRVYDTIETI